MNLHQDVKDKQLGFQDAVSPMTQGIMKLHHHILEIFLFTPTLYALSNPSVCGHNNIYVNQLS
jgi:hypothetical protein